MRVLIVGMVLVVLGMAGAVAWTEYEKSVGPGPGAIDPTVDVLTISTGEEVEIDPYVPRRGLTIVEFTAGF